MEKALATFRNGNVELDKRATWAEGTRLEVAPARKQIGLKESEWPATEAEKEEWLAWLHTLEPFEMTEEELNSFEANLEVRKKEQKELLRRSWQAEDAS